MNEMFKLSEQYDFMGIKLSPTVLLVLKSDIENGAQLDSRLTFSFDPELSAIGNVLPLFTSFNIAMPSHGDLFWFLDLRTDMTLADYTVDEMWTLMAKEYVSVNGIYFFNIHKTSEQHGLEITDIYHIGVAKEGMMTFKANHFSFSYTYDENDQPDYDAVDEDDYEAMLSQQNDDYEKVLRSHFDLQSYRLRATKGISFPYMGFAY